jgi:hypothetical protein
MLKSAKANKTVLKETQSAKRTQGLPRALIEPQSDLVQVGLRETREICSSREILSQQAIGVLKGFAPAQVNLGLVQRDRREAVFLGRHKKTESSHYIV